MPIEPHKQGESSATPEQWSTFPGEIDGKPASYLIDWSWLERGPDPKRTVCIRVRLEFSEQDGNGFPSEEEYPRLSDAVDAIVDQVRRRLDAVHVGERTHDGARELFLYAKSSKGLGEAAAKAVAGRWSPDPSVAIEDDKSWSVFAEELAPDSWQMRYMLDVGVVYALKDAGDALEAPRKIEHYAVFPTHADRRAFIEWCTEHGFAIDGESDDPDDDELPFGLDFSHVGTVELEDLVGRTSALEEAAAEHNGMYDGWQSPVIGADGKPLQGEGAA